MSEELYYIIAEVPGAALYFFLDSTLVSRTISFNIFFLIMRTFPLCTLFKDTSLDLRLKNWPFLTKTSKHRKFKVV